MTNKIATLGIMIWALSLAVVGANWADQQFLNWIYR